MNALTPKPLLKLTERQETLKLGFIGGAVQSAVGYSHFVASGMDNRFELVAGCFSQNALHNRESAATYGVSEERTYDTWQAMLANEKGRLDAIVVLTPTPAHFACVSACIEAGFPVICEKSLAANSEEAKKILDKRNQHHGFLAVTYNYSGYPMVRELAQKIKQGDLGKILHFQIEMPQEGFIRVDAQGNKPTPQAWRLQDGNIPTLHLDLAVHLHQMVYYLTGQKPLELVADQSHYGWFDGIVDNVSCLCRYTQNIQGQIWFSKSALGHRNGLRIRVYGTEGSAEWVQVNPEELMLSYANGRREILDRASPVDITQLRRYNRFKSGHPAGFLEAFANLYNDIADSLRQYQATGDWHSQEVFSAELALEGLHFLEGMVKSVAEKRWITVDGQTQSGKPIKKPVVKTAKKAANPAPVLSSLSSLSASHSAAAKRKSKSQVPPGLRLVVRNTHPTLIKH